MQFGIFYEHQLPRPWQPDSEERLVREALEQVELADRLGVDYAWEVEHHFLEEYSHSSAPEVFLAACAARTRRIRLGHGIVLVPPGYNHPARVAERIAMLDLISGGRVEFGTGESASRMELEGFGIDPAEKRAMWQEAVAQIALMLSCEPYPGHAGTYFRMPPRNVVPKPVQKPHPPMWLACSSRPMIHLAAQLGLGALTFAFVDVEEAKHWVADYYETFARECTPDRTGREPEHRDGDRVQLPSRPRRGRAPRARGLPVLRVRPRPLLSVRRPRAGPHQRVGRLPGQPDADARAAARESGPRTTCAPRCACSRRPASTRPSSSSRAGTTVTPTSATALELFATDVMPEFRDRHDARQRRKAAALAPHVERALSRRTAAADPAELPVVRAYGRNPATGATTYPKR